MGTSYTIYAEVRVRDKWFSINPYVRKINGEVKMIPLDSWGSCFFQTYNELEEQCYMHGRPDNLSEEMKKLFPEADEDTVPWGKSTYKQHYGQYMIAVNFGKAVASRLLPNRDTRYQGYVYKPTIASWELQEIEGIYSWLTKEEFEKILDKDKGKYSWYEWNEWDDWYEHYVTIARKVRHQLHYFSEYAFWGQNVFKYDYDERYPDESDVRLIIYMS